MSASVHSTAQKQPLPDNPFSISVVASGPYRAPAQIELVACVTHPEKRPIERVEFYNGEQCIGKAEKEPYEITWADVPIGNYNIQARAYIEKEIVAMGTAQFEVISSNRYNRGWGSNQAYLSSIIAVNNQRGVLLDGIDDFSTLYGNNSANYPWFLRAASGLKNPCNHIKYDTDLKTINYLTVNSLPKIGNNIIGGQPPFVAFGSSAGGTPLYINEPYAFGIAAGGQDLYQIGNMDIQIEVYKKKSFDNGAINVEKVFSETYELPRPDDLLLEFKDQTGLNYYDSHGLSVNHHILFHENGENIDFETQIEYLASSQIDSMWGQVLPFALLIKHRAANTDYYYKISIKGNTITNDKVYPMAKDITQTHSSCNICYTLDFDDPAPWSTTQLTLPHFQGTPLTSAYEGKSVDELIHQAPRVKDNLPPPAENQFSQLDNSPELKSHPEIDQLVAEHQNDPMALANYVQNEIELTDAIGFNIEKDPTPFSINSQGVMRDALATYMEGQGSPIEQCALLIYLLRKAGVPAAYVFPETDKTLMFDEQLSKMLHTQLRGTMTFLGPTALPELIPVNYPWVGAYIDGKWIHLFPWIKDTRVSEGKDLWNYFPTDYNTATKWLLKYLYNDPSIRNPWNTSDPEILSNDNPATLLPLYAEEQLEKSGLTLKDIGIRFTNHPHYYSDWNEFPRPWQTPLISSNNLISNLDEKFFDTLEIKIFSNRTGKATADPNNPLLLETGVMRFADLHDRRLLLYHEIIPGERAPDYQMILSLEPYNNSPENQGKSIHTFKKGNNPDPGDLTSAQKISTTLQQEDNSLTYQIITKHHQQTEEKQLNYFTQFPGLFETTTQREERPLAKGDMAALGINYGRVTQRMKEFELQKYFNYLDELKANPSLTPDPEIATGQILHIMGKGYYYYCSEFNNQLESLTKMHIVTNRAEGFAKLSPERNADGTPVTTTNNGKLDFNLVYPRVDMFYHHDVCLGNRTAHNESGMPQIENNFTLLQALEGSSEEHRIINEFFNQKSAISTVRLLDIAQGWTPETGRALHPGENITLIDPFNYQREGSGEHVAFKSSGIKTASHSLKDWASAFDNLWGAMTSTFLDEKTGGIKISELFDFSIINQAPVIAPGQEGTPFTGMGAIVISSGGVGAYISASHSIEHGGYGGATTPISSSTPDNNNAFNQHQHDWENQVREEQAIKQMNDQLGGKNTTQPTNQNTTTSPTASSEPSSNTAPIGSTSTPTASSEPPTNTTPNTPTTPPLAELKKVIANNGFLGAACYYGKLLNHIMDPVSVVTGEFYINSLDLQLSGPMPLEIRRIYGSKNLSDNSLGSGWKLGTIPYLILSIDGNETTPASMIHAAQMDGSVIAYRFDTNIQAWKPLAADNPNLINPNDGTPTASLNLFNNVITKNAQGTYILKDSDGTTRYFSTKSFPLRGDAQTTRSRPYLDSWQDAQGNSYSFTYGTNPKKTDYGALYSMSSNNGNALYFHYDSQGHISEIFSSDGRHLHYQYDTFGDLIKVTLPDHSEISYTYSHAEKATYSTHLLIQETTPNGRTLQNSYDEQRRVVTQASSRGKSSKPTLSATFTYSLTGSNEDNTINGTTSVKDANGNTTIYEITKSQISKITYPENRTVSQTWDPTLRALVSRTDARGLVTSFAYDAQGNLTSRTLQGNITGNSKNETAKTSFTYNTNNMVTSITDPSGNSIYYAYGDSSHPMSPTQITKTAEGKTVSSTSFTYQRQGLPASVSIDGSTTSYSYDAHGLLSSITQTTGTDDPDITTTLTTNKRGEIISAKDSRGIIKKYYYDAYSRPIFEETYGADNKPIDWHGWYYNWNGELEWEQGSRFNPVDYTYYDYDRAGHLTHQAVSLSKISSSKLPTDAGIATREYTYDALGNCLSTTDPNGHKTTMSYDALGNMLSRSLGDGSAQESFTYERGGKVATHTTVLGGSESYKYTSTGQILSASYADGTTSSYEYDLSGRLVKETFPNGTIASLTYQGNTITRTFIDAQANSLGSTSETYDGGGKLISNTDLAGNSWNFSYDGLGRLKREQGPLLEKTYLYQPGCRSWVNGKGEWQNTFLDGIGRPVLTTLFNADGSIAYNQSNLYSGDHQSVTTTIGRANNTITTTTTTDLQGRPILIEHPDGSLQMRAYDASGNLFWSRNESGIQRHLIYNALNQVETEVLPYSNENTMVHYERNPLGEILKRTMPGGITEESEYNRAGQKVSDALVGSDGSATRQHTYAYQNGLLASMSDPRGFTTYINYDGWGHPTSIISSGSKTPEQNQNTSYTYDPRGLLTSVAQCYASDSTGPSTLVCRDYDSEGHLSSESTLLSGKLISSWNQTWDGAGNRTGLTWELDKQGPNYAFSYNALGLVSSAQMRSMQAGSQSQAAICSYAYGDNGLLLSKQTPAGTTTLSRDGYGNVITTTLPDGSIENLSWREGQKLASYSIVGTQNETRNYQYDGHGRLIEEPYTLMESANASVFPIGTHTACYSFDDLGVRISSSVSPTGLNSAGSSGDVIQAKNSFDQPTLDTHYSSDWYYYPWNIGYDPLGEVASREIENGTAQSLTWDSFGRLVRVTERNQNNQGYNWSTIYDGLGRRIATRYADATGTQETCAPINLTYYYDPEFEFLELGRDNFGRTWNLYGPDRSGTYGGAQGIGGLEASLLESRGDLHGVVNNFFGDALGITTDAGFYPWGNVLGGYGPMPGSSVNADLVPQWRDHYLDWTGFYYMGARYYEPKSGRFLSPDPLGHDASLSLYDYCDGDPVNGLDPDGRCVEKGRELGLLSDMEYQNATNIVEHMNNPALRLGTLLYTIAGMELSYVDGDLNDPSFLETRNRALQEIPNPERFMSVNGIFTDVDRAQANARSIAKNMGLNQDAVLAINNYTHEWRDLPRAFFEQLGFIDLRSIYLADIVNFNNGGKVTAYSNGSIVVKNATPYMTPSAKAHFEYTGLNPQRYIEKNEAGFKSATNIRNRYDVISILFPTNYFKKWDTTLKTDTYFFDILGNHSFQKNYPLLKYQ